MTVPSPAPASPADTPRLSRRAVALRGVRAVMPMMPGVIPFALVSAFAAREAGMSLVEAMGLATIVFAGASQIAFAQLLGSGAVAPVILLTVLVINLRMVMYSATLAPHLRGEPAWRRALASYILTDQAFALSVTRFTEAPEQPHRAWFFFGTAIPLWVVWQGMTLVGLLVGARVPPEWGLEFTVPLVFLVLLVPAVRDRPTGEAALVGGTVAVLLAGLPYNLGLIVAAVSGIAWGVHAERRRARRATAPHPLTGKGDA
ncbi:AzlC family ABC transporter permease [Roseospira visakhapatnamensis]|uniref:4-azaleucine resistance transporter AzlC n=1 Tax=Roseospira visakhapatnamensis TaxID=390880 RepID=A0A7W6W9X4_9PROT|nr:AzlC family ABC transporter permease [Roseospira visakhapatnamensis]MBB4266404.1 4-azaleucine resistance transporter AzlC [Roseospira visakhapatnamensis]